jgi:hypothetical protein
LGTLRSATDVFVADDPKLPTCAVDSSPTTLAGGAGCDQQATTATRTSSRYTSR